MNEVLNAKITCVEKKSNFAKYEILGLERGFGVTLGGSLERIMLKTFEHVTKVEKHIREENDKDALILKITTDGEESPNDILVQASKKLKEYFDVFTKVNFK